MTKRQKRFLLCCAVLLVTSMAIKYVGEGVASASLGPQPPRDPATAVGVHLVDVSTLPEDQSGQLKRSAIAESRAIAAAQAYAGERFANRAPTIEAKLYLFTDSQYGSVDEKSQQVHPTYENKLAWVIAYKGISFLGSAGPRGYDKEKRPYTEFNVVIDATTGEVLEAYRLVSADPIFNRSRRTPTLHWRCPKGTSAVHVYIDYDRHTCP